MKETKYLFIHDEKVFEATDPKYVLGKICAPQSVNPKNKKEKGYCKLCSDVWGSLSSGMPESIGLNDIWPNYFASVKRN